MPTVWRHKKRGTIYEIITDDATLQCATEPEVEAKYGDEGWTVYRNLKTGAIFLRMAAEFHDGRFEQVEV